MHYRLISFLSVLAYGFSAVFCSADNASHERTFVVNMPYALQCEQIVNDNLLKFKFNACTADLYLSTGVSFGDGDNEKQMMLSLMSGAFTMGVGLLLYPLLKTESIGENDLNVSHIKIVKVEALINCSVNLFHNGISLGIFNTDNKGEIVINNYEGGVYELIVTSKQHGLTLTKEYLIE